MGIAIRGSGIGCPAPHPGSDGVFTEIKKCFSSCHVSSQLVFWLVSKLVKSLIINVLIKINS
jgi:hypothetical protein